jgi:superfamily I DNA and/or RNA helicase
LKKVVAVVTPFRKQASFIRSLLNQYGLPETLTIGTVHYLLGDEDKMVFFSPVYETNQMTGGYFFEVDSICSRNWME